MFNRDLVRRGETATVHHVRTGQDRIVPVEGNVMDTRKLRKHVKDALIEARRAEGNIALRWEWLNVATQWTTLGLETLSVSRINGAFAASEEPEQRLH